MSRTGPLRKAESLRRSLAAFLLSCDAGEPIPGIRELAAMYGASVGATQMGLRQLADEGAITLDSLPRRGGRLLRRDIGLLYAAAEPRPVVVSLSLPSTERINGLATAIRSGLANSGIEAYLTFTRGSRPRLSALAQGRCSVAVMSALAAKALAKRPAFDVALILPPGTFVREHRVFYRREADLEGRRVRVAIDRTSYDFECLTELEFGPDVEYVPLNYLRVIREIEAGRIDAGVLDVDDVLMRIPHDMASRPLSQAVLARLDGANLASAFVVRGNDLATMAVLNAYLDPIDVVRVQDDVIAGRRPPEY